MQLIASARKTGAIDLLVLPSQPLEHVLPAVEKHAQQVEFGTPLLFASAWQPACSPGPAEAQVCFTKVNTLAQFFCSNCEGNRTNWGSDNKERKTKRQAK